RRARSVSWPGCGPAATSWMSVVPSSTTRTLPNRHSCRTGGRRPAGPQPPDGGTAMSKKRKQQATAEQPPAAPAPEADPDELSPAEGGQDQDQDQDQDQPSGERTARVLVAGRFGDFELQP